MQFDDYRHFQQRQGGYVFGVSLLAGLCKLVDRFSQNSVERWHIPPESRHIRVWIRLGLPTTYSRYPTFVK